jgi:hypothetical protein
MAERSAVEITWLRTFTQTLPSAQTWFGKGPLPDGTEFSLAVGAFGEAALTVVRTFPARLGARHTHDRPDAGKQPAPQSIVRLCAEMAWLRDQAERLREETRSLLRERRFIVATARLPLTHPARKLDLDCVIARRPRRYRSLAGFLDFGFRARKPGYGAASSRPSARPRVRATCCPANGRCGPV